jgi:hypothetical protein
MKRSRSHTTPSQKRSVERARENLDDVLRTFSWMVFMPRNGECFDEAVQKRKEKFGTHTPEFYASYLNLAAKRVKYLAQRAAVTEEIRPCKDWPWKGE